jgi:DNA polymerase-3 subunit beta
MNKITISNKDLSKGISAIYSAVDLKNVDKSLNHIKFSVSGSTLTLTGYNTELQLISTIPLYEMYEEFSFLIPARKFKELVSAIPDSADVSIHVNHKEMFHHTITYSGSRAKYKLVGVDPSSFPFIELNDKEDVIDLTVPASHFHYGLMAVSDFSATNDVRYFLNGVNLVITDNSIVFCATDGHRLSRYDLEIETLTTGTCIIPRSSVLELLRQLVKFEGNIKIIITKSHFCFKADGYSYITSLVDGNYPDTNRVIPKDNENVVRIKTQPMLDALNRSNILVNAKHKCARFIFSNNNLTIESTNAENETSIEQLDVNAESFMNVNIEIGLNLDYLSRAFKTIDTEYIDISLKDSGTAIIVQSQDKPQHLSVVMPSRL